METVVYDELPLPLGNVEFIREYISREIKRVFGEGVSTLKVSIHGYPGIIFYVPYKTGMAELTLYFRDDKVFLQSVAPTPEEAKKYIRIIERVLLAYAETEGKASIFFVYVPGKDIMPPRMVSKTKNILQKLFLGNLVFLFALSIMISYIVYIALGPYYTPPALVISQIPIVLLSHKIAPAIMGDWEIDKEHSEVRIIWIQMPIEDFQRLLPEVIYPRRYEIKKKIYEEAIRGGIVDYEKIRSILEDYGIPAAQYLIGEYRIDLYSLVKEVVKKYGLRRMPRIYLANIILPNAAASGVSSRFSSLIITTGLLSRLNKREIEAVVGHEISHIRRHDVLTFFVLSNMEYISRVYIFLFLAPSILLIPFVSFLYLYLSITLLFFMAKFIEARADIEATCTIGRAFELANALHKIGYKKLLIERTSTAKLLAWLSWNPHPPLYFRIKRLREIEKKPPRGVWREAITSCLTGFIESLMDSF